MAFSSAALSTSGMIFGAIGAYGSAQMKKDDLSYQAEMSRINAKMAEFNATKTLEAGEKRVQAIKMKGAQIKSAQKVGMAASGVDLSSESAIRNLTSTDFMAEDDANTANANAIASAWGFRTEAAGHQGAALRADSASASINPTTAMLGSLLGSGGQVAKSWYQYSEQKHSGGSRLSFFGNN